LCHGPSRFTLDLAFTSMAPRVVLYGPSGAGKTQTLRLVAGIGRPDAGHLRVAGTTMVDCARGVWLSPQQRRMGCVFQDYALFPHLTVRQNIAFALHGGWRNPPRTATGPGSDPRTERWLEQLALHAVAGLYPHQLSGGQRQRTALARALVHEPAALLLDEPFAALDKPLRQRLREELLALQQQLQVPMLLITHDDDDVRALAQQVVTIQQGRVSDVTSVTAPAGVGTSPAEHR
jgi:molybdate transport system ATP-binding protein